MARSTAIEKGVPFELFRLKNIVKSQAEYNESSMKTGRLHPSRHWSCHRAQSTTSGKGWSDPCDKRYRHISLRLDAAGNITSSTDAKGQTTQITRDALDRPSQIALADGKTQQLSYDAIGNLSQATDRDRKSVV